jgi:hypothetical protein
MRASGASVFALTNSIYRIQNERREIYSRLSEGIIRCWHLYHIAPRFRAACNYHRVVGDSINVAASGFICMANPAVDLL